LFGGKWCVSLILKPALTVIVVSCLMGGCGKAPSGGDGGGEQPGGEAPKQGQFLALAIDGTGFAKDWWGKSLDTASLLLTNMAKPKDVVCVMTIDDNSYEEENVVLGPERLPGSTLKTHSRVRDMKAAMRALQAPDTSQMKPGTDLTGVLHMLSDYLEKQPNTWLNLFVFSDLVEEKSDQSYTSAPKLPQNTRVVCLFVDRGKSEAEWLRRKEHWTQEMGNYGVPASQVFFFDPRESEVGNFSTDLLKEYRRPPSNLGGAGS